MAYMELANSDHPATLVYLVDISGSMDSPMTVDKTRIQVTKDALQSTFTAMSRRSMRQGVLHSRYRIAMIAYTDLIYDVYRNDHTGKSFIDLEAIQTNGVPAITAQKGTNMAKAIRYAAYILQKDISTWSQKWLEKCPAPMVINLTDCEFVDDFTEVSRAASMLKSIEVPDGNVLFENIFITDQIKLRSSNHRDWIGYYNNDKTGDEFGDGLLRISSTIPDSYVELMNAQGGLKIMPGTSMMFPGISSDFVMSGFAMSMVTGAQKI